MKSDSNSLTQSFVNKNHRYYHQWMIAVLILFNGSICLAMESKVYPIGSDNFNDLAYSANAQSSQGKFTIKMIVNTYKAKQKPVYNPISATGTIDFQLGIAGVAYHVAFPAWVTKPLDGSGVNDTAIIDLAVPPRYSAATIESAFATRNLVVIRAKTEPSITTIDGLGNYTQSDRTTKIDYLRFTYDQRAGTPCPPPPAPQPTWCTLQGQIDTPSFITPEFKQRVATQWARFWSRPLSVLHSVLTTTFAFASPPIVGNPQVDSRWGQPDFDRPDWGNFNEVDARFTAIDGPLGTITKIFYGTDLKQLEIHAVFPSLDESGIYF